MTTFHVEQTTAPADWRPIVDDPSASDLSADDILNEYRHADVPTGTQDATIPGRVEDRRSAARVRARVRQMLHPYFPDDPDEAQERADITAAVADWQGEAIAEQCSDDQE